MIIVETGALEVDANSYETRANVILYALARNVILPDSVVTDAALIKAAQYIESKELMLKGLRVSTEQFLCFPRIGLMLHGSLVSETIIHRRVKNAQMEGVLAIHAEVDLFNPQPVQIVVAEEVADTVAVKYAEGKLPPTRIKIELYETLLFPFYKNGSGVIR